MKDLYAQLGIDRTATAEEIAASARQRPDLEDSASILLDAGKRAVYDGAHANLKLIGELRRRLHLDSGDSWFARNHGDFLGRPGTPAAVARPDAPAAAVKTLPGAVQENEPRAIEIKESQIRAEPQPAPRALDRRVIGIVVALAMLAALAYFFVLR